MIMRPLSGFNFFFLQQGKSTRSIYIFWAV
jgi:hypothetical protein